MSTSSSTTRRLARLGRDGRGVAASEFALFLPILALIMIGVLEFGLYINDAATLNKSLRAGSVLAARSDLPLSGTARTNIANIVRTGGISGNDAYLLAGWGRSGSRLTISTSDFSVDGKTVPVIRLEARLPYEPLFASLLGSIGFSDLELTAADEQAHIGD